MSIVTGTFSISGDKSGKQFDFSPSDANFDCVSSSEEPMGTESQYQWTTEFTDDVSGDLIEIDYSVWEYPIGA